MICQQKFFGDQIESEDEDIGEKNTKFNLMFVDSDQECISKKIHIFKSEHPDWTHDKVVAAAHGYCGKSKKDDIEATPQSEIVGGRELGGRASPAQSTSISPFSKIMKLIKTAKGLKVGGMGLVPFKMHLPMKNLNRLQTKFEKMFTMEQQFLTSEELAKRAEYAKLMKKSDSELLEDLDIPELVEEFNETIRRYKDKFPEADDDQVERHLFSIMLGVKEDSIWVDSPVEFGTPNASLKNIIKAPVILAREMVQKYDFEQEDGSIISQWHFKPYDELKLAIEGVDKISMIVEHQDSWTDIDSIGCVRQLVADDNLRAIRGMGYFVESKTPQVVLSSLREKKPIKVSIGFRAEIEDSDGEYNGFLYNHIQRNMLLDHLAICIKSTPRCPIDKCGVNVEEKISTDSTEFTIINKANNYYNISNLIYDSLEEKNEISNITEDLKGDSMTQKITDDKPPPNEPDDFEAIFGRLWRFMGGEVDAANKESAKIQIREFLSKFGDDMDQKELEDAIALKDAEIKKLNEEIGERINKILTIKKFTDAYTDDELSKMTLPQLELLEDATSRFNPSDKKPEVIPVAGKSQELKDEAEKEKVERIDPRDVFADTNKEFNLYGY
jgi:hypothetical protein